MLRAAAILWLLNTGWAGPPDSVPITDSALVPNPPITHEFCREADGTHLVACGVRALALIMAYWDAPVGIRDIESGLGLREPEHETSFFEMARFARARGMVASGYRMELAEFMLLELPAIVRIRLTEHRQHHFTVAYPDSQGTVFLIEPTRSIKPERLSLDRFRDVFTGEVLVVAPEGREPRWLQLDTWASEPPPATAEAARPAPGGSGRSVPFTAQAVANDSARSVEPDDGGGVAAAGSRIEFEYRLVDFGAVQYSRRQVFASFPFRNRSSATVTIESVRPGCGCRVADLEKREYAPGEGGHIDVTVDLASRQGDFRTGIAVLSNDDANKVVDLGVNCFVVRDAEAYPDRLALGDIDAHTPRAGSLLVKLWSFPSRPLPSIRAIRSSFPAMSCRVEGPGHPVQNAVVYDVRFKLDPPMPLGEIKGSVEVEYDAYDQSKLAIPVIGRILDGIVAFPAELHFGIFHDHDSLLTRITSLRSLHTNELVLRGIHSDHPALATEYEPQERTLRVTLNPRSLQSSGRFAASIALESQDGGSLVIPILGHCVICQDRSCQQGARTP